MHGLIIPWLRLLWLLWLLWLLDVGKPFHVLMLAQHSEVMRANRVLMHSCITIFWSDDSLWFERSWKTMLGFGNMQNAVRR